MAIMTDDFEEVFPRRNVHTSVFVYKRADGHGQPQLLTTMRKRSVQRKRTRCLTMLRERHPETGNEANGRGGAPSPLSPVRCPALALPMNCAAATGASLHEGALTHLSHSRCPLGTKTYQVS